MTRVAIVGTGIAGLAAARGLAGRAELELFEAVLAYARTAVEAPGAPLPDGLTAHSFSWTGGGVGPELA